jgi:hypothetical protein
MIGYQEKWLEQKAKLALDEEYSIGRTDTDPVDDYRRYTISLNADEVPT